MQSTPEPCEADVSIVLSAPPGLGSRDDSGIDPKASALPDVASAPPGLGSRNDSVGDPKARPHLKQASAVPDVVYVQTPEWAKTEIAKTEIPASLASTSLNSEPPPLSSTSSLAPPPLSSTSSLVQTISTDTEGTVWSFEGMLEEDQKFPVWLPLPPEPESVEAEAHDSGSEGQEGENGEAEEDPDVLQARAVEVWMRQQMQWMEAWQQQSWDWGGGGNCMQGQQGSRRQYASEILQRLEQGDLEYAVEQLKDRGTAQKLAVHSVGCWAVQEVFEKLKQKGDEETSVEIAMQFRGFIADALKSPHGNYVVQKIVKVLPLNRILFVIEEVERDSARLVRARYGIRIFQRLLEIDAQGERDDDIARLINRVLADPLKLASEEFGHLVLEHVLEYGLDYQKRKIIEELRPHWLTLIQDQRAGYVFEKVFKFGLKEQVQALMPELLSLPSEKLAAIAAGKVSGMALRALVKRVDEKEVSLIRDHLKSAAAEAKLRETKNGKRISEMVSAGPKV